MWLLCRLVLLLLATSWRATLASSTNGDLVSNVLELKKILEISLEAGTKYSVHDNTIEFSVQGKQSKVSSEVSFSGPALLQLWNEDKRGFLIVTPSGTHHDSNETILPVENGRVVVILYDARKLCPVAEAMIRAKLANQIKKVLGVSALMAVYEVKKTVLQQSDSLSRLLQPSIQFGNYERGLVFVNSAGQETVITQQKVSEKRLALFISNHCQRGLVLISGINTMLYSSHTFRFPLKRGPALVILFDASKMTRAAESQVRDRIVQVVKTQDPFTRDSISVWDRMGKSVMKIILSYGLHGVVAIFERNISLSRRDPLIWDKSSLTPGDLLPDDDMSEQGDTTDVGNEHDKIHSSEESSVVELSAGHLSLSAQASPPLNTDPTVLYQIGVGCEVEVSAGTVSFSYPLGKIALNQIIVKETYPVLMAENFTRRGLLIQTPREHHCWLTGDVKKLSLQSGPTIAVAYDASLMSDSSESHLRSQLMDIIQVALREPKSLEVDRLFQTISAVFSAWEPKPSIVFIAYPQMNLAPEMSLAKASEVGVVTNECPLDDEDAILSTWLPDIFGPDQLQKDYFFPYFPYESYSKSPECHEEPKSFNCF